MNRRSAVQHIVLLAGAAVLLPSCLHDSAKTEQPASLPLHNLRVSAKQEKQLTQVCETILPRTNTPGAQDLGVHLYVLKMLDDCSSPEDQQTFLAGLTRLDDLSQRRYTQSFSASSPAQQLALLSSIEQQQDSQDEVARFYQIVKRLTVAGYTNSKYFLTKQVVYELIPSRYDGYFPVKDLDLTNPHHGQS